jgi:hypothetical protein
MPEIKTVVNATHTMIMKGLGALGVIVGTWNFVTAPIIAFVITIPMVFFKGFSETFKLMASTYQSLKATSDVAKTGLLRLNFYLSIIGFVIEAGFTIYMAFSLASAISDTTLAVGVVLIYTLVSALSLALQIGLTIWAYALALASNPAGWVVSAVLAIWAIADFILSKLGMDSTIGMAIKALISLLCKSYMLTAVDLGFGSSSLKITDTDNNGITVGDEIRYFSKVQSIIRKVSGDTTQADIDNSYIKPYYTFVVPSSSSTETFYFYDAVSYTYYKDGAYRQDYSTDTYAKLGTAMPNFPLHLVFWMDYKYFYETEFAGIDSKSSATGLNNQSMTTFYYDVMPNTIDDFAEWSYIRSNDFDGDCLNNTDEIVTDAYNWDTDGDLLSDSYENDIGADPTKIDTDQDGLDDLTEYRNGFNTTNTDTDGDGLSDFAEYHGWIVNITYFGKEFYFHVRSDPTKSDTDGDGIDDLTEYRCYLNPSSKDTNGDGIQDEVHSYYVTTVEAITSYAGVSPYSPCSVDVDAAGNSYVGYDGLGAFLKYGNNQLPAFKFGGIPHGTNPHQGLVVAGLTSILTPGMDGYVKMYSSLGIFGGNYINFRPVLDMGVSVQDIAYSSSGATYLLFSNATGGPYSADSIWAYAPNGSVMKHWGAYGSGEGRLMGARGIALDAQGNVYIADTGNNRVQVFYPNGSFMKAWGSPGAGVGEFNSPVALTVEADGDVLVVDYGNNRIQKFDHEGRYITEFGNSGDASVRLDRPTSIAENAAGMVYVADHTNVKMFVISETLVAPEKSWSHPDSDGDGLPDILEDGGWSITVRKITSSGSPTNVTYLAASNPYTIDSDVDRLTDYQEFYLGTDPSMADTDLDGVRDLAEIHLGTSPINCDSDYDGILDGWEIGFGSNPSASDTDGDELTDMQEMAAGTDPNSNDTDSDGISDAFELVLGSSPLSMDSDEDGMFDGPELAAGTDLLDADTDDDGLEDGIESWLNTDPTNGDTDGDGLSDRYETLLGTDPMACSFLALNDGSEYRPMPLSVIRP